MMTIRLISLLSLSLVGSFAFAHTINQTVALKYKSFECSGPVQGQVAKILLDATLFETTVIATGAKSRSFIISGSEISQNNKPDQYGGGFVLGTADEPVTEAIAQKLKSLQPSKIIAWRRDQHLTMPGDTITSDHVLLASYGFVFGQKLNANDNFPTMLDFNFQSDSTIESTFQNPKHPDGIEASVVIPFTSSVQISDSGRNLKLNLQIAGREAKNYTNTYEFYDLAPIGAGDQILKSEFVCERRKQSN